ncbi:MAG: hybrid sensor histidine kinase/response regulator [Anaerolineae bacterium]|nr:hybrid sensor histidine kinase/response regulator [Anaerolineae bacterium]
MREQPHILIVDDEPTSRDTMEGLLYKEDYHLTFAPNVSAALDQLSQIEPDVILMDVMMPVIDGFEACRRIKNNKQWQHIPLILVTALNSKEDIVRGLDAGADEFLSKPVNGLELRARVRSMLRIKRQYDELAKMLRLREDMASMIVHDLRVPLTSILGFSELLLIEKNFDDQQRSDLERIHQQSQRMHSFVNDLLILAKAECDQFILNRSTVDITQLVQDIEQDHRIIAQSKKVKLVVQVPNQPQEVALDKNLFHRVLDNLVSNALKFSPSHSKVTVRLEPGPSNGSGNHVRIKILDEGPGVPPEHRHRIFNKFEVVTLKQQTVSQIGLGLAFCKMVMEAHGGEIWVEDNIPTGSAFILQL